MSQYHKKRASPKPPCLQRNWKQCAGALCYPLSRSCLCEVLVCLPEWRSKNYMLICHLLWEGVYKVVIIVFKIIFQLMSGSCVHQRRFSRFQFTIFTLPIVYPAHQGGLCKWYAPLPKQNFAQPLFPVSPAHYNHPKEIVRQFFCNIYRR